MSDPTVLIVPGLRDQAPQHWQTLLESELRSARRPVRSVPPMGREDLDCARRVAAIEHEAADIGGPFVIVAHSGGCIMVAHWAQRTQCRAHAALLATPADFDTPMPDGYPGIDALQKGGWLPLPRVSLPFRSIVAASRDDPLGHFERVAALAQGWGSELVDLGCVGHLNPASGFGDWPGARQLVARLF